MPTGETRANRGDAQPLTEQAVFDVLRAIPDPEMPISIVDLGIIHAVTSDIGGVTVDVTPTFVGCPALDMIRADIERRLRAAGAAGVVVNFINDPPWSVDRISDAGRAALRQHGVTVPAAGDRRPPGSPPLVALTATTPGHAAVQEVVACPFCGQSPARLDSVFGPTRCRMIYYCEACRNSFEHLRRV